MVEVSLGVQRKKVIGHIGEKAARLAAVAITTQCVVNAIGVVFLRIQARAFAKSSLDTRTYLVCIHPTVLTRKQPRYGEAERVSHDSEDSGEEGSECRG
jgi:hypothetical protein